MYSKQSARDKIKKMKSSEKDEFLEFFFTSPYYSPYVALRVQMEDISTQIREAEITFGDDDDSRFDSLMKWVDKSMKMGETMDFYMKRLNPKDVAEANKSMLRAKPAQLESKIKNRNQDDE